MNNNNKEINQETMLHKLSKHVSMTRVIHSIKTAIACLIGVLTTKLLQFPSDQWVVLTIIIVMCSQLYVGSVVSKSILRFFGTLFGCLFASIILETFGHSELTIALTISFAGLIFSYVATSKENLAYTGTLGAVTATIIMLTGEPTLLLALERFIEISLGILIATLVSQFILPIHARTHLKRNQAKTLTMLREYYQLTMMHEGDHYQIKPAELDENIVQSLIKQRQLAQESKREPLGVSFNSKSFIKTLYFEREILRAITYMRVSLSRFHHSEKSLLTSTELHTFHQAVIETLRLLTLKIENQASLAITLPNFDEMKHYLEKTDQTRTQDERISLGAFIFATERLLYGLGELKELT